jgi:hypothetical protein
MSTPFVNISRLRLDKGKEVEQLKDAVARFENHIYKSLPPSSTPSDLTALTAKIQALETTIQGLGVAVIANAWPGFGTDALHAMKGDYQDPALTFFSKKGIQLATLGSNSVTFDATVPFSEAPVVSCWLAYADGTWAAIIPNPISTTGMTVAVASLDGTPSIYYIATGKR